MKNQFYGVYTALLTPFNGKDRVDVEKLKRLIDYLVSKALSAALTKAEGIKLSIL